MTIGFGRAPGGGSATSHRRGSEDAEDGNVSRLSQFFTPIYNLAGHKVIRSNLLNHVWI